MIVLENDMLYIPSPIKVAYSAMYQAIANKSGRMQYHMQKNGEAHIRIGRGEFITAYNYSKIVAVKPLQAKLGTSVFQLEFYTEAE